MLLKVKAITQDVIQSKKFYVAEHVPQELIFWGSD